ncbi:MAG: WG repeat-containing protein [Pyrinomonadaceae bacterium]|nr:WG repeat-containing protein [Pyrinomonadaceae bacterium]
MFTLRFVLLLSIGLTVGTINTYGHRSNPKLIPFERAGKWGFINSKGVVVVKPGFDEVKPFSEGLAVVEKDLKWGFIDANGNYVIEPKFYIAFSFSEGLAAVTIENPGTWGYINHDGEFVISPKFSWAGTFSDGMAEVLMAPDLSKPQISKTGYIDRTGKLVIPAKYGWSESFSDGFALIADDQPNSSEKHTSEYFNKRAFIDKTGRRVTEFYQSAESFSEGLAPVEINSLWGFIDTKGKVVIRPAYDFVLRPFENGFAVVSCLNDKLAFIDRRGKKLTSCIFSEAFAFTEGVAAVQMPNKKFGFINTKGKGVVEPRFSWADSFLNGLAKVRLNRKDGVYEGFINHRG